MKRIFAIAALVALSGPAFAASGDYVTDIMPNTAKHPLAIKFLMATVANNTPDTVVYCLSTQSPGAVQNLIDLNRSADNQTAITFSTGTTSGGTALDAVFHVADCAAQGPSGVVPTHVFNLQR